MHLQECDIRMEGIAVHLDEYAGVTVKRPRQGVLIATILIFLLTEMVGPDQLLTMAST